MTDKSIPCPGCVGRNTGERELRERIERYLRTLPDELKTPPGEYRRRLSICALCEELVNGVCRLCGCYPETRAAKAVMYCPHPGMDW